MNEKMVVFIDEYDRGKNGAMNLSFQVTLSGAPTKRVKLTGLNTDSPAISIDGRPVAAGNTMTARIVEVLLQKANDPGTPRNLQELIVAARYWNWAALLYC